MSCIIISSQELTYGLSGWVLRRRDHGGVIFVDLRDRSGFCQVVFRPEVSAPAHTAADRLRSEYLVSPLLLGSITRAIRLPFPRQAGL